MVSRHVRILFVERCLMQHLYFNSESYKLAARLYVANQTAPTLLLLHGLGFYSFEYERLAPLLTAGGFNCFAFDFRSHGASQGKRGSWTLSELVKDTQNAINYLEKEGYKDFGVFGNSLGATVAVHAAAADQRIKSIVACNCATKPSIELFSPFRKALLFIISRLPFPIRINLNYFIPYSLILSDKNLIAKIKQDTKIAEARKFNASTYMDMYRWDATKVIKNVHVPIFILHGKKDRFQTINQSTLLYDAANEPKKMEIIDTEHVPELENSVELSEVLIQWFRSVV